MITVNEAVSLIETHLPKLEKSRVPIEASVGKILAQEIKSERHQPPFNRMAMDGIAIDFKRWESGQRSFKVEGMQRAGEAQKTLSSHENCMEAMTGGVLPEGASAVIRYEDVRIDNGIAYIDENISVENMMNVHQFGIDHKQGDSLLKVGSFIRGAQVGIIASNGYSEIEVYDTPKIAIVSTGDELVDFGSDPLPHQIRKSNPYALQGELNGFGFEKTKLFHLKDEKEDIYNTLKNILDKYQVVVLSGGVSMGKFDFIPQVLGDLEVKQHFHKVAQRPGKPLWYGTGTKGQGVFALPGNPISCVTCLRRYVIPALFKAMNAENESVCVQQQYAVLKEDYLFNKSLTYFLPVCLEEGEDGVTYGHPIKTNGSGDYGALAFSDGIMELDKEVDQFKAGDKLPLFRW